MIKKLMPLLLVAAMMCFVVNSANASILSVNGGYGTSSVGTGGDYPSLYAAATDFDQNYNLDSAGLFGDWTVMILNSLTEITSTAIGGNTNGHTITILPAVSGITVTYNQPADNAGPTGDILPGCVYVSGAISNSTFGYGFGSGDNLCSTQNIVVEGSSNGSSSQDLTILDAPTKNFNAIIFQMRTQVSNVTVRNCILVEQSAGEASDPIANISLRHDADGVNGIPHDISFINDIMTNASQGVSESGIIATTSGTTPAGDEIYNLNVQGCTITATERGISLLDCSVGNFSNNTIKIVGAGNTGGNMNVGITELVSNSATGWTKTVANNYISLSCPSSAVQFGLAGIDVQSGSSGTWNIYNNVITGFAVPSTYSSFTVVGIRDTIASQVFNIYNNSIYIPQLTGITVSNATACFGIGITAAYATTANILNNIVDVQEPGGEALYVATTAAGGVITSNYNDFVSASNIAVYAGTAYATIAAYQTAASEDANSQSVDPTTTSPASWTGIPASLAFSAGAAHPLNAVPQAPGVTTDITGATRGTPTAPGAYDNGSTVPVELSNFEIGS